MNVESHFISSKVLIWKVSSLNKRKKITLKIPTFTYIPIYLQYYIMYTYYIIYLVLLYLIFIYNIFLKKSKINLTNKIVSKFWQTKVFLAFQNHDELKFSFVTFNYKSYFITLIRGAATALKGSKYGVFSGFSGDLIRKSPYSAWIQENTDQKKLRIWTLSTQWAVLRKLVGHHWTQNDYQYVPYTKVQEDWRTFNLGD